MDKFILKKKRELPSNQSKVLKPKQLTQSTLHSLAGVVVIEDLEQAKHCLESDTETLEKKIQILQSLLTKNPSKEVLIKVGIGKTVNRLRRAGDDSPLAVKLRKASERVYQKWKRELERKVDLKSKPVDVKCDKETERLRASSEKFLFAALQSHSESNSSDLEDISKKIEREIFRQSNKLVNKAYRRLSRKAIFRLKSVETCAEVVSQSLTVKDFVSRYS